MGNKTNKQKKSTTNKIIDKHKFANATSGVPRGSKARCGRCLRGEKVLAEGDEVQKHVLVRPVPRGWPVSHEKFGARKAYIVI